MIERKPDVLVKELLSSEYMFLDSGPVYFHHNLEIFGIAPTLPAVKQETLPIVSEDVIKHVANLLRIEKENNAKLDEAKKALRAAMEQHNIKSCDLGMFKATIAADSVSNSFDSKKFQADNPELYKKYVVRKSKKGGLTIKLKDK